MRRTFVTVGLAVLLLLFAIALWFRVARLQTMPGVNGDEAWYGVQATNLLSGRPVMWRTPSRVPLNPFFVGIEVLLLTVFEPAFWILRAPAVLSGLLAVGLTYVLGTRALDRTTALIATILLATSPIAIGYSRFGWDASQTPLFSLIALMLALRGRIVATAIAFVLCLVIHPTNVFLLPALVFPLVVVSWQDGRRRLLGWFLGTGLAAASVVLITGVVINAQRGAGETAAAASFRLLSRLPVGEVVPAVVSKGVGAVTAVPRKATGGGTPSEALLRCLDGAALATFLGHYGRLMSGITLYQYIVGPGSPLVARLHDWIFWVSVVVLLDFGLRRLVQRRQWDRLALVLGLAASALGIYVVGGPSAFAPHVERYGIFLVVPTLVVLACLVRSLMPESADLDLAWAEPATRRWLGGVAAVGGLLLLLFHLHYVVPLRRTGGDSHVAFRSAQVEPKQQAYEWIVRDLTRGGGPPQGRITAEDWWSGLPIEFLASSQDGITVESGRGDQIDPASPEGPQRLEDLRRLVLGALDEGAYVVGFTGGQADTIIREAAPPGPLTRWTIPDRAGRDLIVVYHRNTAPAVADDR